jgi:DNA polymerase I-like protein with 3'-5' exonuclease and polymerase domains
MITVVDVETSFQATKNGGTDPLPFNPNNILVSIGINDEYYFTNHSERVDEGCYYKIQAILDKTTLLIGHNIKFDLLWLLEAGFKYGGNVYDTMLCDYVLSRGLRRSLTLDMCCRRRNVGEKAKEEINELLDRGVSFENINADIVERYGRVDVEITRKLFDSQMEDLRDDKNKGLLRTIKMMNEFLLVLTDMERNGINIDRTTLADVEKQYTAEFEYLKQTIEKTIYDKMGDTKINPASPEQLSWMIYSKKPKDKNEWAKIFNIGINKETGKNKRRPRYSRTRFRELVRQHTDLIYRTTASQCESCKGKGVIRKIKVDGTPFKKYSKCSQCNGDGYIYYKMAKIAGFNQRPSSVYDVAEAGFRTDRLTLNKIVGEAEGELKEFVDAVIRYGAVETYLNTFVAGIKTFTNENNLLHSKFMQAITATGRLSSRDPNFQNQPRGKTFPIRKVVTSRFEHGHILEIDFSQLEFRTAVYLGREHSS